MNSALASGSLSYNGPRRIYTPNPIIVALNSGSGESSATISVLVPVPDSRTRVKLSLLFVPRAGEAEPLLGTDFGIWVAAMEQDRTGGGAGRLVAVTDIEGTQGTPTPFPASDGLLGYSREFVTAADFLQAQITISSITPTPGAWMLQTRIQPDSVSFGWDEWDEIRRLFQPFNAGAMASL